MYPFSNCVHYLVIKIDAWFPICFTSSKSQKRKVHCKYQVPGLCLFLLCKSKALTNCVGSFYKNEKEIGLIVDEGNLKF
ncbi:hypothetical protein BpHYR1_001005 [Brachionus plicatilis]|uniref:Uncharacterized protein n=1 Tax=Brachionus plicatilis TaxID=10195 RepID=A0A3M7PC10_BRAPC|nr:hypothetical protein BpHYR1_001005 [Brachionus plicatilis]